MESIIIDPKEMEIDVKYQFWFLNRIFVAVKQDDGSVDISYLPKPNRILTAIRGWFRL